MKIVINFSLILLLDFTNRYCFYRNGQYLVFDFCVILTLSKYKHAIMTND